LSLPAYLFPLSVADVQSSETEKKCREERRTGGKSALHLRDIYKVLPSIILSSTPLASEGNREVDKKKKGEIVHRCLSTISFPALAYCRGKERRGGGERRMWGIIFVRKYCASRDKVVKRKPLGERKGNWFGMPGVGFRFYLNHYLENREKGKRREGEARRVWVWSTSSWRKRSKKMSGGGKGKEGEVSGLSSFQV